MKSILYVGLDVHKETIAVAYAGENEEPKSYGIIPNTAAALDALARKLVSTGKRPTFAYEAGPTGYAVYRHLCAQGYACMVAAPSLIPRKAGDRVKTDRRDAVMLARLFRANELTGVTVPSVEDESMRDLYRLRCSAKKSSTNAKKELLGFLLRQGVEYPGKTNWTKSHFHWLDALHLPHQMQQLALQEYIDMVKQCDARVARIEAMLQMHSQQWSRLGDIQNIQVLRGVSFLTAVGLIAELGDLRRFGSPRQLMAYAGLVPSENSSGRNIRRGGITKTGNARVRHLLVEAAWSYQKKARKSPHLLKRQTGLNQEVVDIGWKAQVRMCGRYQRLLQRGKPKGKVVTCIARELAGFLWAIGQQSEGRAA